MERDVYTKRQNENRCIKRDPRKKKTDVLTETR